MDSFAQWGWPCVKEHEISPRFLKLNSCHIISFVLVSGRPPLALSAYSLLGKETSLFQRCCLLLQLPKGAHKIGILWLWQGACKRWKELLAALGRIGNFIQLRAGENGVVMVSSRTCVTPLGETSVVLEWMMAFYRTATCISSSAPSREPAQKPHWLLSFSYFGSCLFSLYSIRGYPYNFNLTVQNVSVFYRLPEKYKNLSMLIPITNPHLPCFCLGFLLHLFLSTQILLSLLLLF